MNGPFVDTCVTAKKISWPGKAEFIKQYLLTVLSTGQHSHWESESIIKWAKQSWELIHGE